MVGRVAIYDANVSKFLCGVDYSEKVVLEWYQ